MKEIIFLFVLFVANVIQAITGFAGTVLAMPPSTWWTSAITTTALTS